MIYDAQRKKECGNQYTFFFFPGGCNLPFKTLLGFFDALFVCMLYNTFDSSVSLLVSDKLSFFLRNWKPMKDILFHTN